MGPGPTPGLLAPGGAGAGRTTVVREQNCSPGSPMVRLRRMRSRAAPRYISGWIYDVCPI
jgi:hypothetical protein